MDTTCNACGDEKHHYAKGMCRKCYEDGRRYVRNAARRAHRRANHEETIRISREYRAANVDRVRYLERERRYRQGVQPMHKNRDCGAFLGIHVAETVLSHVFDNVCRMPPNHPGYDFICSKGKKIDVKSCTMRVRNSGKGSFEFHIRHNTEADYFLLLAFDDRTSLTPLHMWLMPGNEVNTLTCATISMNTIQKWDAYSRDVSRVVDCCNAVREDV